MSVQKTPPLGTYAIQQEEYDQLVSFTRTATFAARRDRVSEFFRADKTQEMLLNVAVVGGASSVGCGIAGGIAGGVISGGTPAGIAIGVGVGVGIGVVSSAIVASVNSANMYEDWKQSVEDKTILDKFKVAYEEHPVLNKFVCSVSGEMIRDPVQLPCGHTFEKLSITQWHDRRVNTEIGATCPDCRAPFSKTQFSVDVTLMGKIKKTYGDIIRNEMKNPKYAPGVLQGFEVLEKSMNEQVKEAMKDVGTKLALQFGNNEITPQVYARKLRELSEIFGDEEEVVSNQPLVVKG